jgi:hypothetical protein
VQPLLEIFDRVFVINLPARTDRRREIAAEFARVGSSLRASNVMVFPAVRPTEAAGFDTIGARGCFLSHLAVLEEAAGAGLRRILVLEDDANFAPGFAERSAGLAAALSTRDWGMFYGGYTIAPQTRAGLQAVAAGLARLAPEAEVGTTHFIGFQAAAIAALGPYFRAMLRRPAGHSDGGPMHVDGAYCWFRRAHPEIATLLAVPEIGYQRSSRTDVHDLTWRDRTPGVRDVVGLLRRWRNHRRMA